MNSARPHFRRISLFGCGKGNELNDFVNKEASYLQTLKQSCPRLDIHSARLDTSDGQFNDILYINDDLLFRFPRYEEGISDFLQEIEVLQRLQGHVSLPIPDPIYVRAETRRVGSVFMGYKMLAGRPLFRETLNSITDKVTLESFAQQLAAFLDGLHHLSPAELGLDLPAPDPLAESKSLFSDIEQHLFPFMRRNARDSVIRHFDEYFNDPDLQEFQPSMIHGDFGGSNILFDSDTITGIIDFSFAGLNDPARDIAAVSTYGDEFFSRICTYYPDIHSLLPRANFYRGTFALYEALHGFRNNDKEAFASGMEQYA
jgi:aminoglycoside 2''-phosphotransferase